MKSESWVSAADRALALASSEIKLIRAVTPENAAAEVARLERAFERGAPTLPRFRYEPPTLRPDLLVALERLAQFLEGASALGRIYAERARELWLEASLIQAVGSRKLSALSRQRFLGHTPEDAEDERTADALALAWTAPSPKREDSEQHDLVESCDWADPRSLVSAMAREAGRLRLAMRVVVQPGLASLAATADGAILVAKGRWIRPRDVARTVLHEIEGHALPRQRASSLLIGILTLGTARGIDDQEGRALLLEEKSGFFDAQRKRELGLRHLAARAALDRADLVSVVRLLCLRGAGVRAAVRIAARVARGATGEGGLAREIVYLPALVRVGRAQRTEQASLVEDVMARGRVAAHVAPLLPVLLPEASWRCSINDDACMRPGP
jgi:hypothetical protein